MSDTATAHAAPIDPGATVPDGRTYAWSHNHDDLRGAFPTPIEALIEALDYLAPHVTSVTLGFLAPPAIPTESLAGDLLDELLNDAARTAAEAPAIPRVAVPSAHEIARAVTYISIPSVAPDSPSRLPARLGDWIVMRLQDGTEFARGDGADNWLTNVSAAALDQLTIDVERVLGAWLRAHPAGAGNDFHWTEEAIAPLAASIDQLVRAWLREIDADHAWYEVGGCVNLRRADALLLHPGLFRRDSGAQSWLLLGYGNPWEAWGGPCHPDAEVPTAAQPATAPT